MKKANDGVLKGRPLGGEEDEKKIRGKSENAPRHSRPITTTKSLVGGKCSMQPGRERQGPEITEGVGDERLLGKRPPLTPFGELGRELLSEKVGGGGGGGGGCLRQERRARLFEGVKKRLPVRINNGHCLLSSQKKRTPHPKENSL